VFLHYFTIHSRYGPACQKLLDRIENNEITGLTSASVLTEVEQRKCRGVQGNPFLGLGTGGRVGSVCVGVSQETFRGRQ